MLLVASLQGAMNAHHHHTHTAKGSFAMLSLEVQYQPKGRRPLLVSARGFLLELAVCLGKQHVMG